MTGPVDGDRMDKAGSRVRLEDDAAGSERHDCHCRRWSYASRI